MAALPEADEFPVGIYQLEDADPVKGGMPNEATGDGMDNIPHAQLARRTRWLKTRVDQLLSVVVAATTTVAGIVKLTNSVTSDSTTTAATAAAAKAANDNANSRALASRSVTGAGVASGGGDLTANRTIMVQAASQAEALAGTATNRAMTPLGVAQAMTGRTIAAAGLATGGGNLGADRTITVQAASQAEAQAGTATNRAMTPLGVAQYVSNLFTRSIADAGYITLPGGLILQWLIINVAAGNTNALASLPTTFPSRIRGAVATRLSSAGPALGDVCTIENVSTSSIRLHRNAAPGTIASYFVIVVGL